MTLKYTLWFSVTLKTAIHGALEKSNDETRQHLTRMAVKSKDLVSLVHLNLSFLSLTDKTTSLGGCVMPPPVMTVLMENKTASPGSVMVRPAITESLNSSRLTRSPALL